MLDTRYSSLFVKIFVGFSTAWHGHGFYATVSYFSARYLSVLITCILSSNLLLLRSVACAFIPYSACISSLFQKFYFLASVLNSVADSSISAISNSSSSMSSLSSRARIGSAILAFLCFHLGGESLESPARGSSAPTALAGRLRVGL